MIYPNYALHSVWRSYVKLICLVLVSYICSNILNLSMLGNNACLFVVCWFFSKSTFWDNFFRNTIWLSNSLDLDQVWRFVRSDLDPNCLQRLSADGIDAWCSKVGISACQTLINNHFNKIKFPQNIGEAPVSSNLVWPIDYGNNIFGRDLFSNFDQTSYIYTERN